MHRLYSLFVIANIFDDEFSDGSASSTSKAVKKKYIFLCQNEALDYNIYLKSELWRIFKKQRDYFPVKSHF